jgi:hypothetical protein
MSSRSCGDHGGQKEESALARQRVERRRKLERTRRKKFFSIASEFSSGRSVRLICKNKAPRVVGKPTKQGETSKRKTYG